MVVKFNGNLEEFDKVQVSMAILYAMQHCNGQNNNEVANQIADIAEEYFRDRNVTIKELNDFVFDKLLEFDEPHIAKTYADYHAVKEFRTKSNSTDEDVQSLISMLDEELKEENSNKDSRIISTQRDYFAGILSKDIMRRMYLPSDIVHAHDTGVLHYHDLDYAIHPMFNCCLINIQDMLDNGTIINGKLIESPKSFRTACTVVTQIIAQIASNQFGGCSINIKHLGRYLQRSRIKFAKLLGIEDVEDCEDNILEILHDLVFGELEAGVQTIQYQINTLMTTNGQSPFVTLFLEIEDGHEFEEEVALIVKEIIKQRIQGIKNENGVYITPSFPKLVYVLDENNVPEDSEYRHITDLCVQCSAKRLYPDYISAKKMREIYDGNVFSPMGCRSFLSPWKDEDGNYKFDGRFNMGVISLNLPQIGIIAKGDRSKFDKLLKTRLKLVKKALMYRYKKLKGTLSDASPVHWQHGAIARLKPGEKIDKYLKDGYATVSLGYIGLYELTKLMTGESHTTDTGKVFAQEVMSILKEHVEEWKKEENIGFGLYGTPAESLCYRFAKIDLEKYGVIKDVTDKGYYTNSYHVDVREKINAFDKLLTESEYHSISTGGCISYIEVPCMTKNIEAMNQIVKYMYETTLYAEFNTKSDYCSKCGFDQEVLLDDNNQWYCPNCDNRDTDSLHITRRTCGYLGDNLWNVGKTKEIKERVLHL